jgi:pyridoxamine 5'-phosphate oxidase-like protein
MEERSRPNFEDYGITHAAEGMLPWSFASERLERSHNYWICTTRPDGRPHAMPVWGVWVEGALYFSTAPSSVKARNLGRNPALVVHLESGDECVILEGVAEQVLDPDPALFERIADGYAAKVRGLPPGPSDGPGHVPPAAAHGVRVARAGLSAERDALAVRPHRLRARLSTAAE